MAILVNVLDELLIFLRRPEAFSWLLLVAAGVPSHLADCRKKKVSLVN